MFGKLRIAFLIDTIDSVMGGTEKQILNIIRRIDNNKFEMTVICLYESAWMGTNVLPYEVISMGYQGFLKASFPLVLSRYLRLLRDRKFAVVQTFFEDSMFVGFLGKLLSFTKHALVISRRDLGLGGEEPAYHKLYKMVKPLILKSVDGIAANAQAIKNHIVRNENIPPEKITVISNALDFPPAHSETPSLFWEHRADLWVGIVANLKPVKRIDLMLNALARLRGIAPQKMVRVVVLGDDHLKVQLRNLSKTLGVGDRVHFMGSVENVGDYLGHIDVGVLCSDKEGLSNAILEYMAYGLPVIATAVGGNSELVDKTNGICIPAGDAEALANAILYLAESRAVRDKLGKESRKKVLGNYTWDRIIPQWERYYISIAAEINP